MGRKAFFIPVARRSHDKRSNIFRRLKVKKIFNEPTMLDFSYINNEKVKLEEFLLVTIKEAFSDKISTI
jgi:hypothetical protein